MADEKAEKEVIVPDILGILPLRGTVVFPHAVIPLGAGRASSVRLIEEASQGTRMVGAVAQRNPGEDAPGREGLYPIGTVTVIHKVLRQPDGTLRLVVQGVTRFRIVELIQETPCLKARIETLPDAGAVAGDVELEALARSARSLFQKIVSMSPTLPDELAGLAANADDPGALADVIAAALPTLSVAQKQELLEAVDVRERLQKLVNALGKEAEVLELGSKIQSEIQSKMSETQREYYL
ncbi:MAG: LON peptidase substrate-binding domain-containing protein, partial [Dehalococcoidia bacterium]|nr:LON peptidase substrate-binding domain-containing protein [Dehalococcoidia bacterium]